MRRWTFWFLITAGAFCVSLVPLTGQAADEIANEDCLACHDNFTLDEFQGSVHGGNLCTSCHTEIKELPHPEKMKPVNCASCHRMEASVYLASDHGKAMKHGIPAANCFDCHGNSHSIYSARDSKSPVYRLNIPKTCAVCHENQDKMAQYALLEKHPLTSYAETVHGKALLEKQVMSSAVCTDCHGSHDILPPWNPDSHLSRANIVKTCGKCHEGSHRRFAGYLTHATHHDPDKYPVLYYTFWIMSALLVGVFSVSGIHTLMWLPRSLKERRRRRKIFESSHGPQVLRFSPLERRLHLMVITSFLGLAVTGVTLKFAYLPLRIDSALK